MAVGTKKAFAGRPARRSQAERSADTRARIIDAVVESIADEGFAGASAKRISERAGVTWGAVQHHFGDKAAILEAALEDGFTRLADAFADVSPAGLSLSQRVTLFVDRAWSHYSSRHYRTTLEIILNTRRDGDGGDGGVHARMVAAVDGLWRRVFADVDVPAERHLEAQIFTFAALSGLAVQVMLQRSRDHIERELAIVARTVLRLLEEAEEAP